MRSPDYYYPSGNIILIAEGVEFRVHLDYLGTKSEVFRDMALTGSDADKSEDCVVLCLSDTKDELKTVLSILYDCSSIEKQDVPRLADIVRFADKYFMHAFRSSALKQLQHSYPDTLIQWDRGTFSPYPELCHLILQLERVADAKFILPSAYYALCAHHSKPKDFMANWSPTMTARYYEGTIILMRMLFRFILTHLTNRRPAKKCEQFDRCRETWKMVNVFRHWGVESILSRSAPLEHLMKFAYRDAASLDVCRRCREDLMIDIEKMREQIWNALPEIWGLGTWEGLRAEAAQCIDSSQ